MSVIKFESIKIKNFRRHEHMSFDFENGLTGIVGNNGAGKSSIPIALTVGLFGDTMIKGLSIADVVNDRIGKDMEIIIKLSIDDVPYRIERYYKHSKYRDALKLYINDEDKSKKTTGDTYKYIEDIIISKQIFCNTVYFAQQAKDFFTALTDTEQKKIFYSILSLEKYPAYIEMVDKQLDKLNKDKSKYSDELVRLLYIKPEKEMYLSSLIKNQESSKKEADDKIDKLNKDISLAMSQISEAKNNRDSIHYTDSEYQDILSKIASVNSNINNLAPKLEKDKLILDDKLKTNISNLINKYENDILIKKNSITAEFNKYKDDSVKKFESINKNIGELEIEKAKLESDITIKYSNNINEYNAKLNVIHNEMESFKFDNIKTNIIDEKFKLTNEYTTLMNHLNNNISRITNLKDSETILCNKKRKESAELTADINADKKICSRCGNEITDIKHIQNELDIVNKEIINKENIISGYDSELKGLTKTLKDTKESQDKEIAELDNKLLDRDMEIEKLKKGLENEKVSITDAISNAEKDRDVEISIATKSIIKKIDELNSDIANINEKLLEKKNSTTAIFTEEKSVLEEKLNLSISKLKDELKENIIKLEDQLKIDSMAYQKELNDLNTKSDDMRKLKIKIDEINNQIVKYESSIDIYNKEISNINSQIIDDATINEVKNVVDKIERNINKLKDINLEFDNKIKIQTFWKKGFSKTGIPSMLIDSSLPFMNRQISEELNKFIPGKFTVSFDTMTQNKSGNYKEKFNINVVNHESGCNNIKKLSGGELRAIDLCCMKTLRSLSENINQKSINITFMDEALDSLDIDSAQSFCNLLKNDSDDHCNILITHDSNKVADADHILRI